MSDQARMGANTGLLGLFGHPVRHTLSPRVHNAAFRHQGLDLVYLAFDVLPERLPAAIVGMKALGMLGVNLTVPHKEAVLPLLDEVDPLALQVGAVNTVVNRAGTLHGYNTDMSGFSAALASVLSGGPAGRRCLVLGAGGAARAVVAALVEQGGSVFVHNRTQSRAVDLCRAAEAWGPGQCRVVVSERLDETALAADVIVNATTIGLQGEVKELPIPVDTLHSGQVVVDLVYGTGPTTLVEVARQRGAVAVDGKEMLVMQAALAYRLWTGVEPPLQLMRDSVERAER